MLKWLVVVAIVVLVTGLFRPGLRLGRLPGDVNIAFRGRVFRFPFTSTILLSLFAWLILRAL